MYGRQKKLIKSCYFYSSLGFGFFVLQLLWLHPVWTKLAPLQFPDLLLLPPRSPSITVFGTCLLWHVEGNKDQRRRPGQGPPLASLAVVSDCTAFRLWGPTSANIILTASSCPVSARVPEFLTQVFFQVENLRPQTSGAVTAHPDGDVTPATPAPASFGSFNQP